MRKKSLKMKNVDGNSFKLSPTFHLSNKYLLRSYCMFGTRERIVIMSGKSESIESGEKTIKTICLFY